MGQDSLDYGSYLQVDRILSSQKLMSESAGEPAHIEMLYIIVHQAYELWFKLILHELDSVIALFAGKAISEQDLGIAVGRLQRITSVQRLLNEQVTVLETMTPLEFLDFRGLLGTASGFQSHQFRLIENRLGLLPSSRVMYGGKTYDESFAEAKRAELIESEKAPSLFAVVADWLERTPFIELDGFDFLSAYKEAVEAMLLADEQALSVEPNEQGKAHRMMALQSARNSYTSALDEQLYADELKEGRKRLPFKSMLAALFINLYRYEAILSHPFQLLNQLVEIDELMTIWRSRHAVMVHRMLGKKMGTGQSSGFDYLRATIDRSRVFSDFYDLSTLLIPASKIPKLPEHVSRQLRFEFGR
jgi:tryptophan 2,3-dioxygenase